MPIATTRTCNQGQEGEAPDLGHTGVVALPNNNNDNNNDNTGVVALLPGAQKVDAIKCIVILNHGHFGVDVMELTANWVKVPRAKVLLWLKHSELDPIPPIHGPRRFKMV